MASRWKHAVVTASGALLTMFALLHWMSAMAAIHQIGRAPGGSPAYYVVHFAGPIHQEWKAAVTAAGAELMDYLPNWAFIARLNEQDLSAIQALPFVRRVEPWTPERRIEPGLLGQHGTLDLVVLTFPGENLAVANEFTAAGAEIVDVSATRWQGVLRVRADGDSLLSLARQPGVKWIEAARTPQLLNDVARDIIGTSEVWSALGLTGTGQIVAIADTGLGDGITFTGHLTDFAGRIVTGQCINSPGICNWSDALGHGTHVAGSVLGNGSMSNGQFTGIAPGARVVIQSIYSPTAPTLIAVPSDLGQLGAPAYAIGARVHNNSWGAPGNMYNTWAQSLDQFIRDHPDFLVVVAAGNGGVDRGGDGVVDGGSLYSPATAKNALSVGASESFRLSGGWSDRMWGWLYRDKSLPIPARPISDDLISNHAAGLAAFSSRGPTHDGRIKPDLVAPGTNIISTWSVSASGSLSWGLYPTNTAYAYLGGTSQAAPLAAGAAALVREYYQQRGMLTPTAALVKATLVHGAADLAPGQYGMGFTPTVVFSDDAEQGPTNWHATGAWAISNINPHSGNYAWLAAPQSGLSELTSAITWNLSTMPTPTLTFWNRRALGSNPARVWLMSNGSERELLVQFDYGTAQGGWIDNRWAGWQYEGINLSAFSAITDAAIRFKLQCTVPQECLTGNIQWALDDITIQSGADHREVRAQPDIAQGWGRLDLTGAIPLTSTDRWFIESPGLLTGEAITFTFVVSESSTIFRATLAWSDHPAFPGASPALVNDLDLHVIGPDKAWPTAPDRLNNVEQVEQPSPLSGTYTVTVSGYNIPYGPQPFALIVSGAQPVRFALYLPLVIRSIP